MKSKNKKQKRAGPFICWSEDEDKLIKKLYKNKSCTEILKHFPQRTWHSLRNRVKFLNLKRRGYKLNDLSSLNNESVESFYWIGLLIADGHFTEKRISLGLHKKDINHLEKFKKFVQSQNKIQLYKSNMCVFAPCDKINVQKIIKRFKISSNKTHNPINLSWFLDKKPEFFLSFICGFIDGDGTVFKRKNRKESYTISIVGYKTWIKNFHIINDFLYNYFKENKRKIGVKLVKRFSRCPNDPIKRKNTIATIAISNSNLIKNFTKKIKELKIPAMERKWGKVSI